MLNCLQDGTYKASLAGTVKWWQGFPTSGLIPYVSMSYNQNFFLLSVSFNKCFKTEMVEVCFFYKPIATGGTQVVMWSVCCIPNTCDFSFCPILVLPFLLTSPALVSTRSCSSC